MMFENFDFFYMLYKFVSFLPLVGCAGFLIGLAIELFIHPRNDFIGIYSMFILFVLGIFGLNLRIPAYKLYQKYGDVLKCPISEVRSSVVFYK